MNKRCFVCKFTIFLEKEFIQEGGNNRKIELKELSNETQTDIDATPVPVETEPIIVILNEFKIHDFKRSLTPVRHEIKLSKSICYAMYMSRYQ